MPAAASDDARPLIVHVVFRFETGGLENGVVNLVNHMPVSSYRHAVVAVTEVAPDFSRRIHRDDVETLALHKTPGHGVKLYPGLLKLFRDWRPAIVHTRNLAALECQVPAALAGVPVRIHGEHGRDADDPLGAVRRYQWLRRAYRPFVHHYVALSRDLESYLEHKVGVPPARIAQIHNGVDVQRFARGGGARVPPQGCPFTDPALFVVGTVGRMKTVKAQPLLAQAFVRALQMQPQLRERMRLVMVGDGPLRAVAQAVLDSAGISHLTWLPGERADVPDVMRGLDCFVLPSLAEGISNTILEAMASSLPVLATDVGGNSELVLTDETGRLVPAGDIEALATGLAGMAGDPAGAAAMGKTGRTRVELRFSLPAMVSTYQALYDRLLAERLKTTKQG